MNHLLAQITGINTPSTVFTNSDTLLTDITSRLLLYGIAVAGFIFFCQLLMGGFNYLTAMGDSGKINAASQGMTRAIIGLVIVISAYFIAQIMQYILGVNLGV
jgi:hypothetical protein